MPETLICKKCGNQYEVSFGIWLNESYCRDCFRARRVTDMSTQMKGGITDPGLTKQRNIFLATYILPMVCVIFLYLVLTEFGALVGDESIFTILLIAGYLVMIIGTARFAYFLQVDRMLLAIYPILVLSPLPFRLIPLVGLLIETRKIRRIISENELQGTLISHQDEQRNPET